MSEECKHKIGGECTRDIDDVCPIFHEIDCEHAPEMKKKEKNAKMANLGKCTFCGKEMDRVGNEWREKCGDIHESDCDETIICCEDCLNIAKRVRLTHDCKCGAVLDSTDWDVD